ncbi:MAG: hypothetical protein ACRDNW_11930 [Trebonia sp.]
MIGRKTRDERPSGWIPDLKVPEHTLWLPVASDKPLNELAQEAALNILGTGAPEDQLQKFARVIHDGTKDCKRRGVKMGGLIFFPDYNRLPPIANVDVFGYYSKDPERPNSLEFYRQLYGTPDKDTVGPVEVNDLTLPAGPAIRFHRRFWPKAGLDPISHLWEEVIFAIMPPEIDAIVVLRVAWVEFSFTEELINAADAVAPTLTIKRRDG